jgi:hypothetical protein
MAYKVLAQSNPSATTATTLYTVPASSASVISTITICNQAATATYRIAVRPGGASLAAEHYVAYDIAIAANDTTALTLGLTLAATDVVTVYASSATLSFHAYGSEALA